MSSAAIKENEAREEVMLCASCGTAGSNDIKLRRCNGCFLVRYCSVKCQKDHRPQHKKECKKRAAELRDEILFKQPEGRCDGDCPICCLPLPLAPSKSTLYSCCCKLICRGCSHANEMREIENRLQKKCPFCRKAPPKTQEEFDERLMKRIEVNDPFAMCDMGRRIYIKGDYKKSFEYWTRAAALGDVMAHFQLSTLYRNGQGVEEDGKKELHHLEQAAIGGHPHARHNLGFRERLNGRMDRAVKHWVIAAKLGYDDSLGNIKALYEAGLVSKDDFTAALRGYQAAIEATKSPQREEAAEYARWVAERKRRGI